MVSLYSASHSGHIAGKLHMLRVECTRLRARQHEQMDVDSSRFRLMKAGV
jgi:hypothetical protein